MQTLKDAPRIEPRIGSPKDAQRRARVSKDRLYELLNSGEIESYLDEVRAVIERRAEQDSRAIRQLQNEAAANRKKECNGTSDQKAD